MRGSMRRRQRRRYRVGARTVNFTSIGLVASAIIVVLEVTAPSSAPPALFSFPAQADHPALPTAPSPGCRAAGGGAAVPARRPDVDVDAASASSVVASSSAWLSATRGRGVAVGVVGRHRVPDDGRAGSRATPQARSWRRSGASTTVLATAPATAPATLGIEKAAVAAAGASPHASPNADRSDGNGNAGNGAGANGHGNGGSFKSEPIGPAAPDTLVSPVRASATAPSERGPAPGPEATDPSSRGFGERRPATAGPGGGEGQDGYPAAAPGRTSPPRR